MDAGAYATTANGVAIIRDRFIAKSISATVRHRSPNHQALTKRPYADIAQDSEHY